MAATLALMLLCLLAHADGQVRKGCMKWSFDKTNDNNVCCDICHPGNRLVKSCGPSSEDLCTPCQPHTYSGQPKSMTCSRCTQCTGALVLVKECTLTSDTVCGCKEGLACGDPQCSFCITACGKGQEPSKDSVCRTCPNGTFNDQIHQKCKPWSTRCPNPDQKIVALGDAFSDIQCEDVIDIRKYNEEWPLVWSLVPILVLVIIIIIIFSVTLKIKQGRKSEKVKLEPPVIGTPTDNDDMTLIAIECSFHEAEQEQGSLDTLCSDNSTKELID